MYISNFGEKENNNMALYRLTHLVVNDGQLGANWLPIGPQLYPDCTTIVPQLVYDLVSTMA